MKVEIKVTELSHDDLVSIFSAATYGNSNFAIDWDENDNKIAKIVKAIRAEHAKGESTIDSKVLCIEDIWAQILLRGGKLRFINCCEDEDDDDYCKEITLQDMLNGCSNAHAYTALSDTLSGAGDMYDAWNLVQIIMFGEVIYG